MKKSITRPVLALVFASLSVTALAQEGNKEVISQTMEGHIFRPAQKDPTADRIAALTMPSGFKVQKYSEGLGKPRMIAVTPEGFTYVTNREEGTLTLLQPDRNGDGMSDGKKILLQKDQLHGITYHEGKLYLITVKEVYTTPVNKDGSIGPLKMILKDLPDGGQHGNRTLAFGPDGKLYVSCGSTCNTCKETNKENATMVQANADGSGRRIFAKGLRNTIGFDWNPTTLELWGFDHGIDWLGDEDQREELNRITDSADYGWPYIYADGKFELHADPPGMSHQQYAVHTTQPVLLYTAHAAPMQLKFYTGSQFPAEYRGDAIATMHGSWNRGEASGYKIVRVHYENGQPTRIDDFITGFLTDGGKSQFARLCGLAQLPDGSMLVSEDANGVVYRISYGS